MRQPFVQTLLTASLALALGCSPASAPAGPLPSAPQPERDAGVHEARRDAAPPADGRDAGIVTASDTPPPISGGTLAITADGALAVAADPDLDAIFVVDLVSASLRTTIELDPGDEPGRIAIDGASRAHVVLRGGGAIVSIDLAADTTIARRAVCAVPRGIAWRASDDTLHVACADGLLVMLPAAGGPATRTLALADDLRDVVVSGDELFVTRFRASTILRVSATGELLGELTLPSVPSEPLLVTRMTEPGPFEPAVAWRAIAAPGGGVTVLHQRALSAEFQAEAGYGSGGCGQSIVHAAVSSVGADGTLVSSGPALGRVVLGVDLAISPDGARIAIASPAAAYARAGGITTFSRATDDVVVFGRASATSATEPCIERDELPALHDHGAVVAVAFRADGTLIAQTRAPAALLLGGAAPTGGPVVALSTRDAYDTGHTLFHARTGGDLACASCHPEGGDDGRTWRFSGIGPRRTQTMRGGLLDTAPFHWNGDMDTFRTLVHAVFEGRMSGAIFDEREIDAFASWMDALPALPRPAVADPAAVERGRTLFHDATVACATCHVGDALTTSVTVDVGTGSALQVPTLLGIAYRAPYMHDGCAPTLHDRFGTCGGGDTHGRTSHLGPAQIDDLVAYLRTL